MDEYHFCVLPDTNSFTLYLPNGKRIMGHGNILKDKHYRKYLLKHQDPNIYCILEQMIAKYNIHCEQVLLMDADIDRFRCIKNDSAYLTASINALLQQLVDS